MAICLIETMSNNKDARKIRQAVFDEAFLTNRSSSLSLTNRIPFPMKLFQILEDVERIGCEWIVSWSADGNSFRVHNNKAFVQRVMPQYFRQTRYKSFQRQLHLYGFSRLTSGKEKGDYSHPQFMKNRRDLCQGMIPLKKKQQLDVDENASGEKKPANVTDDLRDGDSPWEGQNRLPTTTAFTTALQFLPAQNLTSNNHDTIASGVLDAREKTQFAMQQGISSVYPFNPHKSEGTFSGEWLSNTAAGHYENLTFLQGTGSTPAIQPLFQARSNMMVVADEGDDGFNSLRTSFLGQAMILPYQDPFQVDTNKIPMMETDTNKIPMMETSQSLPEAAFPDAQSSPQNSERFAVPTQSSEEDTCTNAPQSICFDGHLTRLVDEVSPAVQTPSEASLSDTHGLPEDFDFSILEPRPFKTFGNGL